MGAASRSFDSDAALSRVFAQDDVCLLEAVCWVRPAGAVPAKLRFRMGSEATLCHELRINDENKTWRIVYRVDLDAILVLEVFNKKTAQTPERVISICKRRMKAYDDA